MPSSSPEVALLLPIFKDFYNKVPDLLIDEAGHMVLAATVNGQTTVKAPDWGYVPAVRVP
jgi:hypothetical protein